MIKKILSLVLCFGILSCSISFAGYETVKGDLTYRNIVLKVGEEKVESDAEPFIYKGKTYIPARALAEAMGGTVVWDDTTSTISVFTTQLSRTRLIADGIYNSMLLIRRCDFLLENINDLIGSRNSLVLNSSNKEEIISSNKEELKKSKEKLNSFINDEMTISSLKISCEFVNKEYSEAERALYCMKRAYEHIESGYKALDTFDKDEFTALQNYAVCNDKAYDYYEEAYDFFDEFTHELYTALWIY